MRFGGGQPTGRFTTIPRHGNRDIPKGTLKAILRDLEISSREFHEK
jgi:predicted RNA binding protein YcfA (HicA-like mRNA interferase family)